MQKFVSNGILFFENDHYLIAPKFNQSYNNYTQYKTIETTKDGILNNFHSYVKNSGFISYKIGKPTEE